MLRVELVDDVQVLDDRLFGQLEDHDHAETLAAQPVHGPAHEIAEVRRQQGHGRYVDEEVAGDANHLRGNLVQPGEDL